MEIVVYLCGDLLETTVLLLEKLSNMYYDSIRYLKT